MFVRSVLVLNVLLLGFTGAAARAEVFTSTGVGGVSCDQMMISKSEAIDAMGFKLARDGGGKAIKCAGKAIEARDKGPAPRFAPGPWRQLIVLDPSDDASCFPAGYQPPELKGKDTQVINPRICYPLYDERADPSISIDQKFKKAAAYIRAHAAAAGQSMRKMLSYLTLGERAGLDDTCKAPQVNFGRKDAVAVQNYSFCVSVELGKSSTSAQNKESRQRLRLAQSQAMNWNSQAIMQQGALGQCVQLASKALPDDGTFNEASSDDLKNSLAGSCLRGNYGFFSGEQAQAASDASTRQMLAAGLDRGGKLVPEPGGSPAPAEPVPTEDSLTRDIDQCVKARLVSADPSCSVKIPLRDSFGNIVSTSEGLLPIQDNYLGAATAVSNTDNGAGQDATRARIGEIQIYLTRIRTKMVQGLFAANHNYLRGDGFRLSADSKCKKIPSIQTLLDVEAENSKPLPEIGPDVALQALSAAASAKEGLAVHQLIYKTIDNANTEKLPRRMAPPGSVCPVNGSMADWTELKKQGRLWCCIEDVPQLQRADTQLSELVKIDLSNPYVRAGMNKDALNISWGDDRLSAKNFPMIEKLTAAVGASGDNVNALVALQQKIGSRTDSQIARLPEIQAALAVLKGDGKALLRKDMDAALDSLCDGDSWLRLANAKSIADQVVNEDAADPLMSVVRACFERKISDLGSRRNTVEGLVGGGCGIAMLVPGLNIAASLPCMPAFLVGAVTAAAESSGNKDFVRACALGKFCTLDQTLDAAEAKATGERSVALQAAMMSFEALGPLAKVTGRAVKAISKSAQLAKTIAEADDISALAQLNKVLKSDLLTTQDVQRITQAYLKGTLKSATDIALAAKMSPFERAISLFEKPLSPQNIAKLEAKVAAMTPEAAEAYYNSGWFGRDLEASAAPAQFPTPVDKKWVRVSPAEDQPMRVVPRPPALASETRVDFSDGEYGDEHSIDASFDETEPPVAPARNEPPPLSARTIHAPAEVTQESGSAKTFTPPTREELHVTLAQEWSRPLNPAIKPAGLSIKASSSGVEYTLNDVQIPSPIEGEPPQPALRSKYFATGKTPMSLVEDAVDAPVKPIGQGAQQSVFKYEKAGGIKVGKILDPERMYQANRNALEKDIEEAKQLLQLKEDPTELERVRALAATSEDPQQVAKLQKLIHASQDPAEIEQVKAALAADEAQLAQWQRSLSPGRTYPPVFNELTARLANRVNAFGPSLRNKVLPRIRIPRTDGKGFIKVGMLGRIDHVDEFGRTLDVPLVKTGPVEPGNPRSDVIVDALEYLRSLDRSWPEFKKAIQEFKTVDKGWRAQLKPYTERMLDANEALGLGGLSKGGQRLGYDLGVGKYPLTNVFVRMNSEGTIIRLDVADF